MYLIGACEDELPKVTQRKNRYLIVFDLARAERHATFKTKYVKRHVKFEQTFNSFVWLKVQSIYVPFPDVYRPN
jgi:hypothetical protein